MRVAIPMSVPTHERAAHCPTDSDLQNEGYTNRTDWALIPDISSGDHPIELEVDSVTNGQNLLIAAQ